MMAAGVGSAAVLVVLVVVGLPAWFLTTTVERVDLEPNPSGEDVSRGKKEKPKKERKRRGEARSEKKK